LIVVTWKKKQSFVKYTHLFENLAACACTCYTSWYVDFSIWACIVSKGVFL